MYLYDTLEERKQCFYNYYYACTCSRQNGKQKVNLIIATINFTNKLN